MSPEVAAYSISYLIGKVTPLLRDQVLQPNRLIRPSIVPLSILAVEAFRWVRKRSDDVYSVPVVGGHSPWVCCALENGCQHEAVFFTIGTPGSRELLEDTVI